MPAPPLETDSALTIAAPTAAPYPAPTPLSWPTTQPPDLLARPAILRADGFASQFELLAFGHELEQQPEIEDLALVRADLEDCWFSVRVAAPVALASALVRLPGFAVDARPHPAGVDATVRRHAEVAPEPLALEHVAPEVDVEALEGTAAEDYAALVEHAPEIVPPRQRYRLGQGEGGVRAAPGPLRSALFGEGGVEGGSEPAVPSGTVIAADARPGGAAPLRDHLTLVVYPFHSFVALSEFQGALRALHGVTDIKVRRFYRGTLQLAVEYDDMIPLVERLRELQGFRWRLVSESPEEIELLLEGLEPGLSAHA